jgi:deoxyinosine 3'endonuclease (endonuclease V)
MSTVWSPLGISKEIVGIKMSDRRDGKTVVKGMRRKHSVRQWTKIYKRKVRVFERTRKRKEFGDLINAVYGQVL